jgi:hypothetical protein
MCKKGVLVLVTCKFTKEKIKKDKAFNVIEEGKSKCSYFKSELVYKVYLENLIAEEEITKSINTILGVSIYAKMPIEFKSKYKLWTKSYKPLEILYTIKSLEKELSKHKMKGIRYIATIIDNNLYKGSKLLKDKIEHKTVSEDNDLSYIEEINKDRFLGNRINILNLLEV